MHLYRVMQLSRQSWLCLQVFPRLRCRNSNLHSNFPGKKCEKVSFKFNLSVINDLQGMCNCGEMASQLTLRLAGGETPYRF